MKRRRPRPPRRSRSSGPFRPPRPGTCPAVEILHSVDDPKIKELLAKNEFFWLKVHGCSSEQVEELGKEFGLHPLAIEDSQEFGQRPKLDDYKNAALLVYYGVDPDGTPVEVHF